MKKLTAKITTQDNQWIYVYNNIEEVGFEALDRGSVTDVVGWGVYSNQGNLKFFDHNKAFYNLTKENRAYGSKVEIFLSSELYDRKMATFLIDDFTYDDNTSHVDIRLKDNLEEWQHIEVPDVFLFEETTADIILNNVMSAAKENYEVNLIVDEAARTHLQHVFIYCPHLKGGSLWSSVTKICEITMCRVFTNVDGVPTIVYDNNDAPPTLVRPHNILSVSNESSRQKTKIPSATIAYKDRVRKYNVPIASRVSYSLYDYSAEVSGDSFTNVTWEFVGADETRNPDITINEMPQDDYGYVYDAWVSFRVNAFANTYAVSSGDGEKPVVTRGTELYEPDPSVRWDERELPQEYSGAELDRASETISVSIHLENAFYSARKVVSSAYTEIFGDRYEDAADITAKYEIKDQLKLTSPTQLSSNELLQKENIVTDIRDDTVFVKHHTWILGEVRRKYGLGVNCCELECLFEDYFSESGTKVIDASGINNAVQSFQKYDIIIPYVQKGGITMPYRTDLDGNAVPFKIIGIKYYYSGVLKQVLCLQEHIL